MEGKDDGREIRDNGSSRSVTVAGIKSAMEVKRE